MKDGSALILGCSQWSTNSDIFSVMLLQLDTIGLILIGFMWIIL